MDAALTVLHQDVGGVLVQQSLHDRQRQRLGREIVALQERRTAAVGIEHIATLVGTVERRVTHGIQQVGRLSRRERAGRENRHLTLEHLVERGNGHCRKDSPLPPHGGGVERDEIISMVEAVGAFGDSDRGIEIGLHLTQELLQEVGTQLDFLARVACIDCLTVGLARHADRIDKAAASFVGEGKGCACTLGVVSGKSRRHITQEHYHLAGQGIGSIHARVQLLEERHEAAHIIERDHRRAIAHEGVVSIVPLGAERIHPNTRLGNEIAQLGEQRDKNLLREGNEQRLTVFARNEARVLTVGGKQGEDMLVQVVVEIDRVFWVRHNLGVGSETVRDIGERILAVAQYGTQGSGVVLVAQLQEAAEVDNLVVAPIADVRPRVLRLDDFPIDALGGNLIGVVAVCRSGIEELGDDAVGVVGIGEREGFPVLENVAPVALIGDKTMAVLVVDTDVEQVPRAARVAMAARESKRQVLHEKAVELVVLQIENALL